MERKDSDFLWELMAKNPPLFPQNPNPTSRNGFSQDYISQNNQIRNLLLQENHRMSSDMSSSFESGFFPNPSFQEPWQADQLQRLETAFGQFNLQSPSHHHSRFLRNNNHSANDGFSNLLFDQVQLPLNRIRSLSAAQALPRTNTNSSVLRRNIENGGFGPSQSLPHALRSSQSLPHAIRSSQTISHALSHGVINSQHRNQSYGEAGHWYNVGSDGIRLERGSNIIRARSINGLEGENSNMFLPGMYNIHLAQSAKYRNCTLEQLKGSILLLAKEQEGCRFLQRILQENDPIHIGMIFLEIKDHLRELITDTVGSCLVLKLFESCNEEQMTEIVLLLTNNEQSLQVLCLHTHGTRAIQKMIENVRNQEQISLIISVLKRITITLCNNQNGHHIISLCLKKFAFDDTKHLIEEIAHSCLHVAMDKSGCCILQQAVGHAVGELKEGLIADITANTLILSEHPYGNYVVQHVLGMNIAHAKADILDRLAGNHVALSMNKYGSNVVEKCLKECGEENGRRIIKELMESSEFLAVLLDPYGNYVAQSALQVSQEYRGDIHTILVNRIQSNYTYLHSHLHGKKVLAKARGSRHRC